MYRCNSDDSTRPMVFFPGTSTTSIFQGGGEDDQSKYVAPPMMVYKSRHISLGSRVASLGDDDLPGFSQVPVTYNNNNSGSRSHHGRGRSDDWLEFGPRDSRFKSEHGEDEEEDEEEEEEQGDDDDDDDDDDDQRSTLSSSTQSRVEDRPVAAPCEELRNVSRYHEVLFIGVVVMAQFMTFAGLGQGLAPMRVVARDLGVTKPGEQAWFTVAYAMTVGSFMLVAGRVGDVVGHKRVVAFGYFFLGSWSGFAGFSAEMGGRVFFNVCRAFQGVGAALLVPNALALLDCAYALGTKKGVVLALWGVMAPWGFVVGALFASMFAEVAWWPWAFWSYGIVAWLLAALSMVVVPSSLADRSPEGTGVSDWDLPGSCLGVLGLLLISVAWNNGPVFGWGAPHVYFILIIGLVSLIAFVWIEAKATSPILPVKAMSSTAWYTLVLVGLGWGSFGIWIYYSFRFLGEIRGLSSLSVSTQCVPAMICGLLAAGTTGFMLAHTPRAFAMFASTIPFFVGELITATQPAEQTYWAQMFVAILIVPLGMHMSVPAATLTLSNSMSPGRRGFAASIVNAMLFYSISLALGIAGTVEVQVNNHGVTKDHTLWGIRCAWWTGVALAGCAAVLGAASFGRTLLVQGWKITRH